MGDSYFIMQHLNQKHNVDLDANLNSMDKAISTAFRTMIEEFMYMMIGMEMLLWNDYKNIHKIVGNMPGIAVWFLKKMVKCQSNDVGLGKHSKDEVRHLLENQLRSISELLGSNIYMMGKEPCELDCTVFGFLAMLLYCDKDLHPCQLVHEKYSNLDGYCDRMKSNFWPDWDEIIETENCKNKKCCGKTKAVPSKNAEETVDTKTAI